MPIALGGTRKLLMAGRCLGPGQDPPALPRERPCAWAGWGGPAWGSAVFLGAGNPTTWGHVSEAAWGGGTPAPPGTHLMGVEVHNGGFGDALHSVKQELARAGEGRGEDPPGPEGAAPQGPREVTGGLGAPPCLWETPGRQEVRVAQRSLCVSAAGTPSRLHPELRLAISAFLQGLALKLPPQGSPSFPCPPLPPGLLASPSPNGQGLPPPPPHPFPSCVQTGASGTTRTPSLSPDAGAGGALASDSCRGHGQRCPFGLCPHPLRPRSLRVKG